MPVRSLLVALALLIAAPAVAADAPAPPSPPPSPVSGTVVSIDATSIVVKGADGKDNSFKLGPKVGVTRSRSGTLADVKAGQFIGCTAVEGPDGKLRATEIHIFPESMRGTGEGHYPWMNQAKTTMTNGNVEALSGTTDGQTIKVSYKGGETAVLIPPSTTVTVIETAAIADVKVGSMVTVFSTTNADGTKTAMGIGLAPAKM
jgi:hypothetical protein